MVIDKIPVVLLIGLLRLATQITAWSGILLYQTPTYRLLFVEPAGVKKPKAKVPPDEIKISPSDRDWDGVRVSLEVEE